METIGDLLDAIRQVRKLETDSALAAALGVSRQTVNNWRQGRNTPDAVACATIAGLSGEPLVKVIGIAGEQRAISREEKAVWRKLAASAALLALVVAPALFQQAHAATLHQVQAGADPAALAAAGAVGLGIMRNNGRASWAGGSGCCAILKEPGSVKP